MSYLSKCKELFFKGITPSNPLSIKEKEYLELMDIGTDEINKLGIDIFSSYFQEMQYLVNLWTAHILFKRNDVSREIKEECLSIIKRYSTSSFDISLANEEKNWLAKNDTK